MAIARDQWKEKLRLQRARDRMMKREHKAITLREEELRSDLTIIHHEPHIKLPPKNPKFVDKSVSQETDLARSQITASS